MNFFNPYSHAIAAMALYLNTLGFFQRLHKDQPTNENTIIGTLLVGYLAFSTIVLAAS